MKIQTIETQVTHTHVLFLSLLPLRGKTTGEQTAFDWMQLPPRQPSTPELPPHPFLKNSGVPLQSGHTCHRANTRAVSEDSGRVFECQPALLWAAARWSPGGASKRLMMRGYVEPGAPRGAFSHVVAKPFNMCRPFNTFSPLSCILTTWNEEFRVSDSQLSLKKNSRSVALRLTDMFIETDEK